MNIYLLCKNNNKNNNSIQMSYGRHPIKISNDRNILFFCLGICGGMMIFYYFNNNRTHKIRYLEPNDLKHMPDEKLPNNKFTKLKEHLLNVVKEIYDKPGENTINFNGLKTQDVNGDIHEIPSKQYEISILNNIEKDSLQSLLRTNEESSENNNNKFLHSLKELEYLAKNSENSQDQKLYFNNLMDLLRFYMVKSYNKTLKEMDPDQPFQDTENFLNKWIEIYKRSIKDSMKFLVNR